LGGIRGIEILETFDTPGEVTEGFLEAVCSGSSLVSWGDGLLVVTEVAEGRPYGECGRFENQREELEQKRKEDGKGGRGKRKEDKRRREAKKDRPYGKISRSH
jgi:hypothetical protein